MRISWRHSLSLRLISLFTLVTTALLTGFGIITLTLTDRHFEELDQTYLVDKARLLREVSQPASDDDDLKRRIQAVFDVQAGLFVDISRQGQTIYRSPGFVVPASAMQMLEQLAPQTVTEWQSGAQRVRAIAVPIPLPMWLQSGDSSATITNTSSGATTPVTPTLTTPTPISAVQQATAILAVDTGHHDHFMRTLQAWLWTYLAIAVLLGALLSGWATRKGLAPLRLMIAKASEITGSQLSARMQTADVPAELATLARSLNDMFARLEQDFERLSDFSADLAHDLRTPLSNMLVQTQVTLSKPRSAGEYQETLLSLVEELERLSAMIGEMLYLAKTENSLETPDKVAVQLDVEANQLSEFYELIADGKNVTLRVVGQAEVMGDRTMIRRALSNLLSNAIRHAHRDSVVSIEIHPGRQQPEVWVTDTGDPIPEDIRSRLFDRFFRGEASRFHPGSERSGLGLAIVRAIMQAHGGSVHLEIQSNQVCFKLVFARQSV